MAHNTQAQCTVSESSDKESVKKEAKSELDRTLGKVISLTFIILSYVAKTSISLALQATRTWRLSLLQ